MYVYQPVSISRVTGKILFLFALAFSTVTNASGDDTENLLINENLAVLCAAMYEYQLNLKGFDINLLETKRHLIGQHMLNIPGNAHRGDKKYFAAKVTAIKDSLGTMTAEQKAELEYDKWSQAGNPCDQIVAVTFILDTTESVRAGKGMTQEEARIIMKKIYPWDDRYAVILDKGLEVQYGKANPGAGSEQERAGDSSEKSE